MTPRKHTPFDDFNPFDDPYDDADPLEGLHIVGEDDLDDAEDVWYKGYVEEHPFCDFGIGDDNDLCIKDKYGCHIEGCPYADSND